MMRNIYYILMALLIICGCDKSSLSTNDTEYTNQYIFFDASVETTKGTLVTGEVLPSAANTSFGVFAYRGSQNTPVFDMYNNNIAHLYRPAERANFKYDKLAMWTAGESHSFYAFYPFYPYNATSIITGVGHNDGTAYITYSQPSALNNMVDVMTASVRNTRSDEHTISPVKFKFNHRLFAIGLTVVNAQTESKSDLEITYAKIEFVGVNTSAQFNIDANDTYTASGSDNISHTYTPTTIHWSTNNTPVSYNFNYGNEFLLIPCESLKINVTLSVKNEWDEEVTYVIDDNFAPTNGKFFEAGKQYTITIKKSDNGITYESLINGWNNTDTDVEIEFN